MSRILNFLKILFFPVVVLVRATRAYRQMRRWREHVVGGHVTVRLSIPQGIFTIDVRSALAHTMFEGTYEKETMSLFPSLKPPDGLIVNIGANVGFYAVQLAREFPNNTILAVEPNPEAYALLVKNIEQNNMGTRIRTVNACISARSGKTPFSIIPGKSEYSSMNGIIPRFSLGNRVGGIEVEAFRLSEIIEEAKVALIVMDVEGAEKLVLEGGKDIIARDTPLILCECADVLLEKFGSSSADLVEFLENLGYTVRSPSRPKKPIKTPYEGNILAFYSEDAVYDDHSVARPL